MLSRLDRYLLRNFLPALVICNFVLVGMYLVVDIFQKLDDLLSLGEDAFPMALKYYSLLLPVMICRLFPATVLIAVGFVLVRLSKGNEIMAMQVSGLSLYRILLPVFITVAILSLMAMGNQEFIVPSFADRLERLRTITFDKSILENLLVEDRTHNLVMRIGKYDIVDETMESIFILGIDEAGGSRYTLRAEEGKWIGNNTWYLTKTIRYDYKDGRWTDLAEGKEYFLETEITPADMREGERDPNLMGLLELGSLSRKQPENPKYPVFFYSRLAYPFTAPVFMLLGIPFIVGFQRLKKNLFLSISILIGLVCAFFVMSIFCTNLGITGNLHPLLAGWLPTLVFAIVGLILFDWMKA